jgi:hypothetical protein
MMANKTPLENFRQSIDNIDAALVYMLAERFRITKAVGEHKAKSGLSVTTIAGRASDLSGRSLLGATTSVRALSLIGSAPRI